MAAAGCIAHALIRLLFHGRQCKAKAESQETLIMGMMLGSA